MSDCPECGGSGKVVFVPPVRETCPACKGSGSQSTRLSDTAAVPEAQASPNPKVVP